MRIAPPPFGHALFVQENNANLDVPDNNVDGGMMVFDFEPHAEIVSSIGLLDIDYATTVEVKYIASDGYAIKKTIEVPLLGDNSYQLLPINLENVKQVN